MPYYYTTYTVGIQEASRLCSNGEKELKATKVRRLIDMTTNIFFSSTHRMAVVAASASVSISEKRRKKKENKTAVVVCFSSKVVFPSSVCSN